MPSTGAEQSRKGWICKLLIRIELDTHALPLSDFEFDCYSGIEDYTTGAMPQHKKQHKQTKKQPAASRECRLQQSSSSSRVAVNALGERTPSPIVVETFADVEQLVKAASVEPSAASDGDFVGHKDVQFFSGNPFVEKTSGILHLYKEEVRTMLPPPTVAAVDSSQQQEASSAADVACTSTRSTMLCLLAVPAKISCRELLQFLSPVSRSISVMRIIRDVKPNQYMVLVTFKSQADADLFYKSFNGAQYNSIEPDLCHLAYVCRLETSRAAEGASLAVDGFTELPTCPVCLERMDESVDGVLTILCNHSFHGSCLSQWGDSTCPVCRYAQTPELMPEHKCMTCGKQNDLWICLICGHVGCGRYEDGHAIQHFRDTSHTFSLQVGTQRVWDYAGDNYVHRLIQSKGDGKVVEFEPGNRQLAGNDDEKLEAITLEYTYLLTNQLETQRDYFEEKMEVTEKIAQSQVEEIEDRLSEMRKELNHQTEQIKQLQNEKLQSEKKYAQLQQKVNKLNSELKEEQEMNKHLRNDQQQWVDKVQTLDHHLKTTVAEKQKEVDDLQEQLRDLMFHFEAQSKLSGEPEEGGEAVVSRDELRDSRLQVGSPRTPKRSNKKKTK